MTTLDKLEVWKPIPGSPYHEASSLGRIRSCRPGYKVRVLRQQLNKCGYAYIYIKRDGRTTNFRVAGLVCAAFHGDRPGGLVCSHIDGDKTNDTPENLCWETQSDNLKRKKAHDTHTYGESHSQAKLTEDQVRDIRSLEGLMDQYEIAKKFGVAQATIWHILHRKTWRHI